MAESANNPMLSAVTEGHQNIGGITNSNESTIVKTNKNNNATRNQRTTRRKPRVLTTSSTSSNSGDFGNNQATTNTKNIRKRRQLEVPPSTSTCSHISRHTTPGITIKESTTKNQLKASKSPRKRIIDSDTEDTEEETRTKDRKKQNVSIEFEATELNCSSSTIASRTRSHGNVSNTNQETSFSRTKISKTNSRGFRRRFPQLSVEDTSSAEETLLHKVKKSRLKHSTKGVIQSPASSSVKLKRVVKDHHLVAEASTSRNLRSNNNQSGLVCATTSQINLNIASTSSAGASGSSNKLETRLASNSSGLSIVAVPKKRQKVGEHQQSPENSGYSEKLSNLGARLARGSREPQSGSSDIRVRCFFNFSIHQFILLSTYKGATTKSAQTQFSCQEFNTNSNDGFLC